MFQDNTLHVDAAGFVETPVTHSTIEEVLTHIAATNGGVLTPDDVVEAARDPASPLHERFEWDDSKAAHAHRIYQARKVIASVRVIVRESERVMVVPQFVSTSTFGQSRYEHIDAVRENKDASMRVLDDEISRAISCIARAVNVAEHIGYKEALQEILDRMQSLRTQLH